eukprot:2718617-Rhodomonas_salina.2
MTHFSVKGVFDGPHRLLSGRCAGYRVPGYLAAWKGCIALSSTRGSIGTTTCGARVPGYSVHFVPSSILLYQPACSTHPVALARLLRRPLFVFLACSDERLDVVNIEDTNYRLVDSEKP